MKKFNKQLTPKVIQEVIGGEAVLKTSVSLYSIADPREAEPHSVIFLDNDKYIAAAIDSKAGLLIVGNKFKAEFINHKTNVIFVEKFISFYPDFNEPLAGIGKSQAL